MNITARIEEIITRKGLTKKEVAQRMGKFDQGFNKLITNPKWQTIEEIAAAMGMSIQDLLFDAPAPAPAAENGGGKTKPDLIVIDRETGETKNYSLME